MHEAFEIGNQVATLMAELASAYVWLFSLALLAFLS
jgi:hypothetical protein